MCVIIIEIKYPKGKDMKIVVPVDGDKKTIVKRTGQAPFFAVFEDSVFLEFVENSHAHGDHDHNHEHEHEHNHEHEQEHSNHHRKDIQKLQACDIILARAVGPQMQSALDAISIKVQKISKYDGDQAQDLVSMFLAKQLKSQQDKA